MRILMVAPVHRELEFIRQNKKIPFLYGQGQEGWYEALKALGHTVKVFRYSDSFLIPNTLRIYLSSFFTNYFPVWKARFNRYSDKTNLFFWEDYVKNNKFKTLCNEFMPELILISGGLHGIWPTTLEEVKKKYNSKSVLFSGVNPEYGTSEFDRELLEKNFFDAVFANDAGYAKKWKKFGDKEAIVLPISSADPSIHKKIKLSKKERAEYISDVCFIGTLSNYRQKILLNLISFDLKIWGDIPPGVVLLSELKNFYKGKAVGEKMVKIYNASKIVINIHEKDMQYGGNMKTFEIPACGAFQLIDNVSSKWFTNKKDAVVFENSNDLVKKVKFYLKNEKERKKIAENGYNKTLEKHLYKHHLKNIFKYI